MTHRHSVVEITFFYPKTDKRGQKESLRRGVALPTDEAVDTGLVSWVIWILMPVLPLVGTTAGGALTVREIRRAQRGK